MVIAAYCAVSFPPICFLYNEEVIQQKLIMKGGVFFMFVYFHLP